MSGLFPLFHLKEFFEELGSFRYPLGLQFHELHHRFLALVLGLLHSYILNNELFLL